jgi:DNA-binding transcriptional MerR regulator
MGELARRLGVTTSALRYYDERRLGRLTRRVSGHVSAFTFQFDQIADGRILRLLHNRRPVHRRGGASRVSSSHRR